MKWTFASAGLVIIGLFGIMIIVLFNEITVSNEQDYTTLKEATEASMIEAVDSAYYRLTGKLKMNQEKFIESFTKRFILSSTFGQGNYYIDFYQITEYPAKVSLRIVDATDSYDIFTTFDESIGSTQANIVNELSAILEGYEIEDNYDFINFTSEGEPVLGTPPVSESGCEAIPQPHKSCDSAMPIEYKNEKKFASISIQGFQNGMCVATVIARMGDDILGNVGASTVTWHAVYTGCPDGYTASGQWCKCNK